MQQLCHLLNNMGAQISGIASNLITIVGVKKLHGAEHKVLPKKPYEYPYSWSQTSPETMTFEKALAYCDDLEESGHNDWPLIEYVIASLAETQIMDVFEHRIAKPQQAVEPQE